MSAMPQPAVCQLQPQITEMTSILHQLLNAPLCRFDERLHSRIPNKHGIYVIYRLDDSKEPVGSFALGAPRQHPVDYYSAFTAISTWASRAAISALSLSRAVRARIKLLPSCG
jgi:hypothetical protein